MGTTPVRWAPASGALIVIQGSMPEATEIWAVALTAPNAMRRVPVAGGGLAVKRTLTPVEAFRDPTVPPTVQLKLATETVLLSASNACPEKTWESNGSID